MTVQIPAAMAQRIAAHKREWAAKEFTYTTDQRERIVELCQPLQTSTRLVQAGLLGGGIPDFPSSPAESCMRMFERQARGALLASLSERKKQTPASEAARLCEAAEAADRLRSLTEGEPWMWPRREFYADLRSIAERARHRAAHIEHEFAHPWFHVQRPVRLRLGFFVIAWQSAETGRRPAKSRTSAAARLLIAAMNPVMQYARQIIRIEEAAPLDERGDNAEYLLRQYLSGEFDDLLSPSAPSLT